jgi:NAD+ synthase
MALSNQTGAMLLTTGNKSEMAVGYATLYGDMNGGFNPIKDLYKTDVYQICSWRNSNVLNGLAHPILPSILLRAPSAELRPGQLDQDTLPPYELLDDILRALVEGNARTELLVKFDAALVKKIQGWLDKNEYKRRQSAPGVKVTSKAFGRDRRWPMTNKYNK